jgi:hypothetical protein
LPLAWDLCFFLSLQAHLRDNWLFVSFPFAVRVQREWKAPVVHSLVLFQSGCGYLKTESLRQEVSTLCPLPGSLRPSALSFLMNRLWDTLKTGLQSLQCAVLCSLLSHNPFLKEAKLFVAFPNFKI